ncbi:complement regulator-acquiring protein [Borreliella bavariensis]|uniref:complement regulator-acquiring protein n=1 Tax=Borreliella bavariensis TaxID=664662 RepID=UPI001F4089B1|nr:complement regulator-acquiring protein [Borreliella bavariensis]
MNKPKLLILITLGIITFFSCQLNYEDTKNKVVASYTEATYDELSLKKTQKNKHIKDQ